MRQQDRRRVESGSNGFLDETSNEYLETDDLEWHPFKVWRTHVLRAEEQSEKKTQEPAQKELPEPLQGELKTVSSF